MQHLLGHHLACLKDCGLVAVRPEGWSSSSLARLAATGHQVLLGPSNMTKT